MKHICFTPRHLPRGKGTTAMEILGMNDETNDEPRETCFFCRKWAGLEGEPLGGSVYRDERWLVDHAAPASGERGTVIASSRRHFLDVTEMTREESASFRELERRLIRAIKEVTGSDRVYTVAMMANVPHFHTWFIPQHHGSAVKAVQLLASERRSTDAEVAATVDRIRDALRHV